MSNTNPTTLPTANNELAELQPEMETLTATQAEQAQGGLLPAVQVNPTLQSIYLQPGTIAGAFDAFHH